MKFSCTVSPFGWKTLNVSHNRKKELKLVFIFSDNCFVFVAYDKLGVVINTIEEAMEGN